MSRIYFHTPTAEAEVSGTERAWMGCLTDDLGLALVDGHTIRRIAEWATIRFPDGQDVSAIRTDMDLVYRFRLYARHTRDRPLITYQGHPVPTWDLTLNTCLRIGSPPVQLAARLHAQCEIHAWVDGPNRAWLADLIGQGLTSGVFRGRIADRATGWESVTELLRSRDDEPVVTSYSVCDQFPHAGASTWMPAWPEGIPRRWDALTEPQQRERSAREETWYDLPDEEQWQHGMDYLRTGTGSLELQPGKFGAGAFHFGDLGLSWLDLDAHDAETRVRKALGLDQAEAQKENQ